MADESAKAAVYVSFSTFENSITQLAQGVPNVIDRTVFPGLSGGVQSQLFAGMRFLGLIDEKSRPLKDLHDLAVTDEAARNKKLEALLRKHYAALFALNLEKTTPGEANQVMRDSYGVSGDTAEKAMRFFLSAAERVGIPLSPLFKTAKATPNGASGSAGATRKRAKKSPKGDEDLPVVPPAAAGESRTVTLRSGGVLTISASTGFLALSSEDRKFVFDLIDKLADYESGTPKSGAGSA
jgi:hypothetical protein